MKNRLMTLAFIVPSLGSVLLGSPAGAQDLDAGSEPQVIQAELWDVSPPLRDMAIPPPENWREGERKIVPLRRVPKVPNVGEDPDPVLDTPTGPLVDATILLNFKGNSANGFAPPDTNASVGATQIMQHVNVVHSIYNKANGVKILGPISNSSFWSGFGGACQNSGNSGDPVVNYDKAAGRWVVLQPVFSAPYMYCVAVSTTSDATGTYNRYAFNLGNSNLPDYPKLGVWPDGYYITSNSFFGGFSFVGAQSCAVDRNRMLSGLSATMICFQRSTAEASLLPADWDGAMAPPGGSPNYHLEAETSTTLQLFKFHVDFVTPANSTFTGPTNITVASYTTLCPFTRACVPQPAPGEKVDALSDRLMFRLAYRNFGTHETLVASHTVDKGAGVAGARWYEIRGLSGAPSVFQQGTLQTPNLHIWMPSIGQDKDGNILLLVNGSNATTRKPSLGFTGREPSDPLGTMQKPQLIINGTGVQTSTANRWGDYASVSIDPADDCTFVVSGEYYEVTGSFAWTTRIASIKFNSCN
jgi:hypothetical protein